MTTSFLKLEGTLTDAEGNVVAIVSTRGQFGPVNQDIMGNIVSAIYEMYPDPDTGVTFTLTRKGPDEALGEVHS